MIFMVKNNIMTEKPIYAYVFQDKKTKEIAKDHPIYWRKEEADNDLDDYELFKEWRVVRVKLVFK